MMAVFATLVAKHVNITLAQSNTRNQRRAAGLKGPPHSAVKAHFAKQMQVAIPRGYTAMWNVDKHGSVILLSGLTEHKLSLRTSCSPTQSVLKPYASFLFFVRI